MSIVNTTIPYTYKVLRNNLTQLIRFYPFLNLQIVGKSILGNNIYVVKLGKGSKQVFYSGAIHR